MIRACVKLQGYNAEDKAALPSRSLASTSTSQGQRLKPASVHLSRESAFPTVFPPPYSSLLFWEVLWGLRV